MGETMRFHDERLPRHLWAKNAVQQEWRRRDRNHPYSAEQILDAVGKFARITALLIRGGWLAVLPRPALLVAAVIQDHAGPNGVAWPGTDRIARLTGLSRSTIGKCRAALVECGLLRIENVGTARRRKYRYTLNEPKMIDQVVLDDLKRLREYRREFLARLPRVARRLKCLVGTGSEPLLTIQSPEQKQTTTGNTRGVVGVGEVVTLKDHLEPQPPGEADQITGRPSLEGTGEHNPVPNHQPLSTSSPWGGSSGTIQLVDMRPQDFIQKAREIFQVKQP